MLVNILVWIVVGAIAGWLAGMVMKSPGGLVFDIVVGIIGAIIGGWVLGLLGMGETGTFSIASIITAFIGAVILLAILRLIRRA